MSDLPDKTQVPCTSYANTVSSSSASAAVAALAWSGSIPVALSLAPSSLSAPVAPAPLHVPLPRQSLAHLGLVAAVRRLQRYAPAPLAFAAGTVRREPQPDGSDDGGDDADGDGDADGIDSAVRTGCGDDAAPTVASPTTASSDSTTAPYPVCWFEDEDTRLALPWHVFVGVLWDLKPQRTLPWRLKLHFTAYPYSQILPFHADVMEQVRSYYRNALKQALCLQHGHPRAALGLTKDAQDRLWVALCQSHGSLDAAVHADAPVLAVLAQRVPVRLYLRSAEGTGDAAVPLPPPLQPSCPVRRADGALQTLGDGLRDWLPALFRAVGTVRTGANATHNCKDSGDGPADGCGAAILPTSAPSVAAWRIQGIKPPLEIPLAELWGNMRHPDHFLYIVVFTTVTKTPAV